MSDTKCPKCARAKTFAVDDPELKGEWKICDKCRIRELEQSLRQTEQQLVAAKAAVVKFLSASGHELCHENRQELAHAFDIEPNDVTQGLPPESEFAVRCIEYRKQLYGCDGPGSDSEAFNAELARLRDVIKLLEDQAGWTTDERLRTIKACYDTAIMALEASNQACEEMRANIASLRAENERQHRELITAGERWKKLTDDMRWLSDEFTDEMLRHMHEAKKIALQMDRP